MITAYKLILLIIISISFLGVLGEKESKAMRNNMTAICIAGMAGFIASMVLL